MVARSLDELLAEHHGRIERLERRRSGRGGGGGSGGGGTTILSVPMASGTKTAGQNTTGQGIIAFPPGLFTSPPVVTVSLNTWAANAEILATNITKDQFEWVGFNTATGGNLAGFGFSWRATAAGSPGGSPPMEAPALPDPVTVLGPQSTNITQAAATWADFAPAVTVTYVLDSPMWVAVDGSGNLNGAASTYAMIGVTATGALTLGAEVDQQSGSVSAFGHTAFTSSQGFTGGNTLTFHKVLLLPKGTTTLRMQHRRNLTAGTPQVGYATMTVTPMAWAGAPGAVTDHGGMVGIIPASVVGGTLGRKVTFSGVSAVSLNGVFTPDCDLYQIEARITSFSTAAGGWIRLRSNGVDAAAAGTYGNQRVYNSSASAVATAYAATTGWEFSPLTISHSAKITAKISNPASSGAEYRIMEMETMGQNSGSIINNSMKGSTSGGPFDGFSLVASSGVIAGWLRVYALT